jgi:cyclohexanone monooxygenase
MSSELDVSHQKRSTPTDFDAVIIGAGIAGLYTLHRLRGMGLSVRVIEKGDGVGGTWYWNRYPGARTDSEASVYCFSFSKELYEEWDWEERYPTQQEMLNYLERVAEKFDLYRDIQFNTKVEHVIYDESANVWTVETQDDERITTQFIVSAMGNLSAVYLPDFEGLEDFAGESYIPATWPRDGVDYAGKRVGIIGTGATAVQLVPVVAKEAGHVYVFQRTPAYVVEAQNFLYDDEQRTEMKSEYDETWRTAREHVYGMPFRSANRRAVDTPADERDRIFEEGWQKGGFRFMFETFDDVHAHLEGNGYASEFLRSKIRDIVKDPDVAELLTPRKYPLGAKRLPAGHSYYEAYNRPNVTLVDISEDGIDRITPKGIKFGESEIELDIIVFATGFDAHTGAMTSVDIRGRDGVSIADYWKQGPRIFMGLSVHGFPNLFAVAGPMSPTANYPPKAESQIDLIADVIAYMRANDFDVVEPSVQAEEEWIQSSIAFAGQTLLPLGEEFHSYIVGANIPGKAHVVQSWSGGLKEYLRRCQVVREGNFSDFTFGHVPT